MSTLPNICFGCVREKSGPNCSHCNFDPATEPRASVYLPIGAVLEDDYVIGKVLGHGGFGVTYAAYDLNLRHGVAIKEYFPRDQASRELDRCTLAALSHSGSGSNDYEYGLDRFTDEAKTLARFSDVPGIVNVQRLFRGNNTAYMVMSYLRGIPLSTYLDKRGGKIPFQEAQSILMPIMDALREVHQQNLLHRDISPDNIFITDDKHVKLIDFGAARMAARDHSQNFSIILKEGFAPEEQYRSRGKQGPWTDLYALGATFYLSITGKIPPQALDRLDEDTLQKPSELGIEIPSVAEAALMKSLSVRAANRFEDIDSFQAELSQNKPQAVQLASVQQQSRAKQSISQASLALADKSENELAPAGEPMSVKEMFEAARSTASDTMVRERLRYNQHVPPQSDYSFDGTIKPGTYCGKCLKNFMLCFIWMVLIGTESIFSVIGAVGMLVSTFAILALTTRRCRDAGLPAWASLSIFMPFYNLIFMVALWFVPTTKTKE